MPDNGDEKTIMLVGATGSGKSTLVDGIVNYVMGVSFEDPFRFTLVTLEEEERKTHNQVYHFLPVIDLYFIYEIYFVAEKDYYGGTIPFKLYTDWHAGFDCKSLHVPDQDIALTVGCLLLLGTNPTSGVSKGPC